MAAPRFWTGNTIFEGAALVPSSETAGLPVEALQDQQRSYTWRSAVGWTITDNNNRIDFDNGAGANVAVIVNGYYATPAAMATAVTAALEAAASAPVWATSYNVAATDKFRISQGSNFTLLNLTGANKYRSAMPSLGYTMTADLSGATGFTAPCVAYQSEHFLEITLTAEQAAAGITGAAIIDSNFVGGQVGNQMESASNATFAWSSPTSRLVLNVSQLGRSYFASTTHQYWRLKVSDASNPIGYFQVGIAWLGNYITSPYCFSVNQTRKPRDFSSIQTAIPGQHAATFRSRRKEMSLEVLEVPDATAETTLRTFFSGINIGENFILDFDPDLAVATPQTGFLYGFLPDTESEGFSNFEYWTFQFPFCEAL